MYGVGILECLVLRGGFHVLAMLFKMNDCAKTLESPLNVMHSLVQSTVWITLCRGGNLLCQNCVYNNMLQWATRLKFLHIKMKVLV